MAKNRADFPRHIDRTKNRSDHYQSTLLEIPCAPELITEAVESDEAVLNPFSYNEEEAELREQLRVAFWRLVEGLTERQKQVIHLYSSGKTQSEIAKMFINQSSITKSMNGNCDYRKDGQKVKSYGGSKRRLAKSAETDEEVQEILRKLKELKEGE